MDSCGMLGWQIKRICHFDISLHFSWNSFMKPQITEFHNGEFGSIFVSSCIHTCAMYLRTLI